MNDVTAFFQSLVQQAESYYLEQEKKEQPRTKDEDWSHRRRQRRRRRSKSRDRAMNDSSVLHDEEEGKRSNGTRRVGPPVNPDYIEEPTTPPPLRSSADPKIPIPIQHCVQETVYQRPAMPYGATLNEDNEVPTRSCLKIQMSRPKSLHQLVAAVRKGKGRQFEDCDAALERRIRDFEQARWLRRAKYQEIQPWGIFGLFSHLSDLRIDLEWAEIAAWRRANGEAFLSWNDFENEHSKTVNRPIFTSMIILISAAMMVYMMSLSDWQFAPLHVNPMFGPQPDILLEAGALHTYSIVHGEWYRLFAPMFLHAGVIHFVLNMLAIWFIGGSVEKCHGFINCCCLFVISAVGGNILSAVFQPYVISVGASGGIFGLMGVVLADIFVNWDLLFLTIDGLDDRNPCENIQVLLCLLFDMLLNIIAGLTPYIDNFAHMGGLLYGIFYALPLVDRLGVHFFGKLGLCFQCQNYSLRVFGFMVGSFLLISSSLMLMNSDGLKSPCEDCRFISCAPFPFWKEDKWWECKIPS